MNCKVNCKNCGKEIQTNHSNRCYCSTKCRYTYLHRHLPPTGTKVDRLSASYQPVIGEVRTGTELQVLIRSNIGAKYKWCPCVKCGKPRWVALTKLGSQVSKNCRACCYKNLATKAQDAAKVIRDARCGRYVFPSGYVFVWLDEKDFYFPMAGKRTHKVQEHRLIMAKHLGRCLHSWEIVHHKGTKFPRGSKEDKKDNRIENLEIMTKGNHTAEHNKGYRDGYQKGLADGRMRQIQELKEEVRLLRWEMKQRSVVI